MKLKNLSVKVNDCMAYLVLFAVGLFAILVTMGGNPILGAIIGCVGFVAWAVMFGFWFVISSLLDESRKQTEEAKLQRLLMDKLIREIEACVHNQKMLDM